MENMLMIAGIIIWGFLTFWFFPNILWIAADPDDGWLRLFIYSLWGLTAAFGPFALTVTSLDAVIKGYFK
jgi:hypothetical protein